ncbi:hypothetical protein NMY22_g16403 [Coprinellus aureogranulatus]|nr:hypothetical protein NMY22_g16403 [Coprinellus aureogranulatus]
MYETLLRPHDVSTTTPLPSISTATERLKAAEVKREEKRVRQIMGNREREARERAAAASKAKEGKGEEGAEKGKEGKEQAKEGKEAKENGENAAMADDAHLEHKRPRTSDPSTSSAMDTDPLPLVSTSQITLFPPSSSSSSSPPPSSSIPIPPSNSTSTANAPSASAVQQQKISVSKALPEVRGHTSYLTFATLVPYAYAQRMKERADASEPGKERVNASEQGKEAPGEKSKKGGEGGGGGGREE